MRARTLAVALPAALVCAAAGACGSGAVANLATPTARVSAIPPASDAATARLLDWPEFGLDPSRSDVSTLASGITAANLAHLRLASLTLPGTVDSSPIYVHGASIAGAQHNAFIVTTSYGKTLAIDADSARILWAFTPSHYAALAGSAQITTASPVADPGRRFVFAASPDGQVHKLALADGREDASGGWPTSVTRDARHEKLAAALNVWGAYVIAATGGYLGDAPPYQGHVVLIDRASGRIRAVFNTLCSNRRALIVPSTCTASDSAILSRGGAVLEPGAARILVSTGNGPWNGTTNFGDSVIELSLPGLAERQAFTPVDQASLNNSDTDLGSSAPVLLGSGRVAIAGKDGVLRVLALSRLDGHPPGTRERLGGEVQRLQVPGGGELFSTPAVWRHGTHTTMFLADASGTAAYVLVRGRLYRAWLNGHAGTSPVMAGGLLYVYDPSEGGIEVYRPNSPRPLAHLPGAPGHWNSPIVVDGHIAEPEGNANDHERSGRMLIFSAP
jgi:outer membrane protein assembly factor BamB